MIDLGLFFGLLLLAMVLLIAEDILPTGGVLGILAAGCLFFLLYRGFSTSMARGFLFLVAEILAVPLSYAVSSHVLVKTGLGRRVYLHPPEPEEMDVSHNSPDLGQLVGLQGRTLTSLRPSGMVDFEGRRLDGIAEEGMIPPGTSVKAIRVQSGRLIVRVASE